MPRRSDGSTLVVPERWENGSFFHLVSDHPGEPVASPWDGSGRFYGSGRDALRALLTHGMEHRGWRRLWTPEYFCQPVVASAASTGIDMALYPDGPGDAQAGSNRVGTQRGDVVLRANFFGLRASMWPDVDRSCAEVIDDHTHDPWSDGAWRSDADWCIASLRKVLPIPDGGAVWSPAGWDLPPPAEVTGEHRDVSLSRLTAMALKAQYLSGSLPDKQAFRQLETASEEQIGSGRISGITEWSASMIALSPVRNWRETRRSNYEALSRHLERLPWLDVMGPELGVDVCPFAVVLLLHNEERRERVRETLVENSIFPMVLWDLETPVLPGVSQRYVDLSRRLLLVHCDMRYTPDDMRAVAEIIVQCGDPRAPVRRPRVAPERAAGAAGER